MCRLYAFRSTENTKVECTLVHSQNALMTQSEQDQSGLSHGHGWGIVTYDGETTEERQAWAAYHGEHFKMSAARVYANLVLAHVRRATVGDPAVENTHPFRHRHWAFAHNGTVPSFAKVKPMMLDAIAEDHQKIIAGQTDSEHLFHYALTLLEQNPQRSISSVLRQVITDTLCWMKDVNAQGKPGLNLVLTNGSSIAGTRLGRTLFYLQRFGVYDCEICGFPHIHHETNREHRAVVVASEPLTSETWTSFPEQCSWQITDQADLKIDDQPLSSSASNPEPDHLSV